MSQSIPAPVLTVTSLGGVQTVLLGRNNCRVQVVPSCSYKIITIISPVTVQSRGGVTMVIKVSLVTFRLNKETFVYLFSYLG